MLVRILGTAFENNWAVGAFVEQLCELAGQRRASHPTAAALFVRKVLALGLSLGCQDHDCRGHRSKSRAY